MNLLSKSKCKENFILHNVGNCIGEALDLKKNQCFTHVYNVPILFLIIYFLTFK